MSEYRTIGRYRIWPTNKPGRFITEDAPHIPLIQTRLDREEADYRWDQWVKARLTGEYTSVETQLAREGKQIGDPV